MARILYSRCWPTAQKVLPVAAMLLYASTVFFTAGLIPSVTDQRVRLALACVGVQTATLLVLTAGLIAGKFVEVRRSEQRRSRLNRIGDLLAAYSLGAPHEEDLLDAARDHPGEFLQVWEASLASLKGSPRSRIEELLMRTGLDGKLLDQLRDPDPGKVLRAIALLRKLENLQTEAIEKALDHRAEAVQTAARITLASRGSSSAQERVLSQLAHLPFWQRVVIYRQIPPESPALQDHLARAFRSADDTAVLAALEFVLSCQRVQPLSSARRLAGSPNVEIRIKFFKALPFLAADEEAISLIRLGLDDAEWRVRAMTARACGVLGVRSLGQELADRFAHASNPVEAGHLAGALAALDGESWHRLQEFTVSDNDMTRAIAAEVIEKHLARRQERLS